MIKQDKIFQKLLKDLNKNEVNDSVLADHIFDYLYSGTNYSLTAVKKQLQKNGKTVAWWQG